MRVVLDSNVIVSALATRGLCFAILDLCIEEHQLILSRDILEEISAYLENKAKVPAPIIHNTLSFLKMNSSVLVPQSIREDACRDPNDLKILGLAAAAKADVIITGDNDLLSLKKFETITIISPRDFWTRSLKKSP